MLREHWRRVLVLTALAVVASCASASGDQDAQPSAPVAGHITTGRFHSCVVRTGAVRCWGLGMDGQLGYGNPLDIGDDETPAAAGPVDFGAGRTALQISAGAFHNCAILDNATLRCWGYGGDGRLGYRNLTSIGDNETPALAGAVNLGAGRTPVTVSAGVGSTCAVLDDGSLRCWGFGEDGRLGYGNMSTIGDDETPAMVAPVDLGANRTATTVSVGSGHACAILDNGAVRCWGYAALGQLGVNTGPTNLNIGDAEPITSIGPVDLGAGHTAKALSAGDSHTCAILEDNTVRCWGFGAAGQLGYGNPSNVGVLQTPGSMGPVNLGSGRTARAITAGANHTCAILDDANVRCWGAGNLGQLGYAGTDNIGDDETPAAAGPVDLGAGHSALAISAGDQHTCALLDDMSVRCWGFGAFGRLGLCNHFTVGDDETPGSLGPIDVGAGGAACGSPESGVQPPPVTPPPPPEPVTPPPPPAPIAVVPPAAPAPAPADTSLDDALRAQSERARSLRTCLAAANRRPRSARTRARTRCSLRYGRTPGRPAALRATALSRTSVRLTWEAPGTDGSEPPAARGFFVKESLRPILTKTQFRAAQSLCKPVCTFKITAVGAQISLTVTNLRPKTTYYFKVAARDNVSHRVGARSVTTKVRTK